ncbi:hypothetical protein SLEP1_g42573 [Rubroshorea leprosula]|uniref:Uncharacterized protein n=1 Tax=Rubroshorea leprosula TaxID=152421 RepID=A0AAV5LB92_9ROSI|nr:hypothetical protein SLEP1_g42573 [Rubroshorea leprosula]
MSSTFFVALFYSLLLLAPPTRTSHGAMVAGAVRPSLGSKSSDTVKFKPKTGDGSYHRLGDGNVKNCLPKGFHYSSAPSRYINGHTFGSVACSPGTDVASP